MPRQTHLRLAPTAAALLLASAAAAQPLPDSENGRYTFSTAEDGVLRLDTRSGQVSACTRKAGDWACYAVPDERAALDAEIGRLAAENARLRQALAAGAADAGKIDEALPKADSLKPGSGARSQNRIEIPLPSDADMERAMSFIERVWRRLVDMAARVREDVRDRI